MESPKEVWIGGNWSGCNFTARNRFLLYIGDCIMIQPENPGDAFYKIFSLIIGMCINILCAGGYVAQDVMLET